MNKPLYLGMSILDISKVLSMNFGMITLNQSIGIKQNYVIKIEGIFQDIFNDVENGLTMT